MKSRRLQPGKKHNKTMVKALINTWQVLTNKWMKWKKKRNWINEWKLNTYPYEGSIKSLPCAVSREKKSIHVSRWVESIILLIKAPS